jgi:RNA polymerase subunit RPABC4/transcription elongation factor Spt4
MKYCKKCGVLYATDVCPKCGIQEPEDLPEPEAPDKRTLVRQWIGLLVGIPLFIMAIYVVIYLLHARG